jgi:hypothetical protein
MLSYLWKIRRRLVLINTKTRPVVLVENTVLCSRLHKKTFTERTKKNSSKVLGQLASFSCLSISVSFTSSRDMNGVQRYKVDRFEVHHNFSLNKFLCYQVIRKPAPLMLFIIKAGLLVINFSIFIKHRHPVNSEARRYFL